MTLTDHINSAVARYREGIALKNMMKIDIRKFYPKEYQVGMHAIEWIKEQTGEDLGDDEAAFIAMHIVSAELNAQNITDVNQITELINTVLQIVRIHFKIDLNEEFISYEWTGIPKHRVCQMDRAQAGYCPQARLCHRRSLRFLMPCRHYLL